MKKKYILYAVLFFAICLFPVAGLAVPEREEVSENRTRAKAPALKDENGWNPDFGECADAGKDFWCFGSRKCDSGNGRLAVLSGFPE